MNAGIAVNGSARYVSLNLFAKINQQNIGLYMYICKEKIPHRAICEGACPLYHPAN